MTSILNLYFLSSGTVAFIHSHMQIHSKFTTGAMPPLATAKKRNASCFVCSPMSLSIKRETVCTCRIPMLNRCLEIFTKTHLSCLHERKTEILIDEKVILEGFSFVALSDLQEGHWPLQHQ